jgi:hypothetical protein
VERYDVSRKVAEVTFAFTDSRGQFGRPPEAERRRKRSSTAGGPESPDSTVCQCSMAGLAHAPAEQHHLVVDAAGKIEQPGFKILHLHADGIDLGDALADALQVGSPSPARCRPPCPRPPACRRRDRCAAPAQPGRLDLSADCLPSMARFSSDSSTGSSDCASSRVKVFMGNALTSRIRRNSSIRSSATGPVLHAGPHLDAVHHAALDQVLQRPGQMLRADAVHGGAQAAGVVERDDALALGAKRRAMRFTR